MVELFDAVFGCSKLFKALKTKIMLKLKKKNCKGTEIQCRE